MVKLREQEGFVKNGERVLTARDELPPGYEAQADMGQTKLKDMYGGEVKIFFFCMLLSFSRMKFVYLSAEPFTTNRFIYAHEKAFKYFGGRPEIIMYDQDRLMVVNENAGSIMYTKAFDEYRERAGFKVFLCRKADPDTKGKVENLVKYIKTSFLDSREYTGIDSLNSACLAWLDSTGNGTTNASTRRVPRELFEIERHKLLEHRPQKVELHKQKIVSVSDLHTITYLKNKYDLPLGRHSKGDRLRVESDGMFISIIEPTTNELVVKHKLTEDIGRVVKTNKPQKLPYPEIEKTKNLYDNDPTVIRFIDKICEEMPRYITQQCRLLKKIHKQYGAKISISAIEECLYECKFDATEVLTLLVKKHGIVQAKNVLLPRTKKHYSEKAKGLSKYSALVEEV